MKKYRLHFVNSERSCHNMFNWSSIFSVVYPILCLDELYTETILCIVVKLFNNDLTMVLPRT